MPHLLSNLTFFGLLLILLTCYSRTYHADNENLPADLFGTKDSHKPLLPFDGHDIFVLIMTCIITFVAAGAGVGGGGVLLPLFIFSEGGLRMQSKMLRSSETSAYIIRPFTFMLQTIMLHIPLQDLVSTMQLHCATSRWRVGASPTSCAT